MNKLVTELAQITKQIDALKERKAFIEGKLQAQGAADLEDTKLKSKKYSDEYGNSVTYTIAQSVSIESTGFLKKLFGIAYSDIIKETQKTTYKINHAKYERMLIALYRKDFTKITIEEFWQQLPCSAEKRKALMRKLSGVNFNKDMDNLINIGEFSTADAELYAFIYADAMVWSTVISVCKLSGMPSADEAIEEIMRLINAAISVSETAKLTFEQAPSEDVKGAVNDET